MCCTPPTNAVTEELQATLSRCTANALRTPQTATFVMVQNELRARWRVPPGCTLAAPFQHPARIVKSPAKVGNLAVDNAVDIRARLQQLQPKVISDVCLRALGVKIEGEELLATCAHLLKVATAILAAMNIYPALFKANRFPHHAEPRLRYDALCGEALAPKHGR
jgi:hypothetical protein